MAIHPKQQKDLVLAPVAAEVDLNLQRLRDKSADAVEAQLELELDVPAASHDRARRTELVLRHAQRYVHMHGWKASITDDACRMHLDGGSVSIDLGLSEGIIDYIRHGIPV